MTARIALSALASILAGGCAPTAGAGDCGVSFHYRSHAPRYYSTAFTQRYSTTAPRGYVYYDDCHAHDEPVVYVGCLTPRVVIYGSCYPRTYRMTYTRSDCYTRPPRQSRATVHRYRSGHRVHHYRQHVTSRHHYSRSRPGMTLYDRPSGSRYRHDRPYDRCRRSRDRHRGSSIRLRIGRR